MGKVGQITGGGTTGGGIINGRWDKLREVITNTCVYLLDHEYQFQYKITPFIYHNIL